MPRCSHTMRVGEMDGSIACGDCGKKLKGAWPVLTLPDPAHAAAGPYDFEAYAEIATRHPRSRKVLTILSTLATGWLPWGIEWHRYLSRVDATSWVMCCGYALNLREAQALVTAGLLAPAVGLGNWPQSLVLTRAGEVWLSWNWERSARKPRADRAAAFAESLDALEDGHLS